MKPGSCEVLGPPNAFDKMTLHFKTLKTYVLMSSITKSDNEALRFLVGYFSLGKYQNESKKADRLLHNPYGADVSSGLKSEPKGMILAGLEARKNFQQKVKFSESLQLLVVKVRSDFIQFDSIDLECELDIGRTNLRFGELAGSYFGEYRVEFGA